MRKCNLIIDSCCDLPFDFIDVDGVDIVHFPYIVDGKSYEDDMFVSSNPHDFYESMRKGATPSTSQAIPQRFEEVFKRACVNGIPTVYLSFTSGLSTSYDNACVMCEMVSEQYPNAELYVVDTLAPSCVEGLLVLEAINQMNKGLSAKELKDWVEEARYFVNANFMVEDLQALKRGGRIPSGIAAAGSTLDVKPFITLDIDGSLKLGGICRGRKKGIKQLATLYEKESVNSFDSEFVIVGHADCIKDAEKLKDLILKEDSTRPVIISNIGPVIGFHVGPGMLAVCYWTDDRRSKLSISERIAKKVKADS